MQYAGAMNCAYFALRMLTAPKMASAISAMTQQRSSRCNERIRKTSTMVSACERSMLFSGQGSAEKNRLEDPMLFLRRRETKLQPLHCRWGSESLPL
jgi:hypothetical protein